MAAEPRRRVGASSAAAAVSPSAPAAGQTGSNPAPDAKIESGDPESKAGGEDSRKQTESQTQSASRNRRRVSLTLVTALVVLILYRGLVFWAEMSDYDTDEEVITQAPQRSQKKKTLGDAEVIEIKARSAWSPQTGSLVEKRPPRPCAITNIAPQVFDPVVYKTKDKDNKEWYRRAYACMIKSGCRHGIVEDAEDRRWKKVKSVDVTFLFLNQAALRSLPEDIFRRVYFEREGSTYIDTILGGAALSGSQYEQYDARQNFVKGFGCSLNDLNVQLPSYRTNVLSECLDVKEQATKASRLHFSVYLAKDGSMQTLTSTGLLQKLGDCKTSAAALTEPTLVVKNLAKTLLLDKAKFSIRAYMLVGSTMPFMVFFRRGYVRVAKDSGNGFKDTTLEDFQRTLANGKITGTHFVDTFLKASMKRVALLLFQASRTSLERRRGSYQLYALNFIVDDQLRVYLESSEPYADLKSLADTPSDASTMIAEMHDLVMELNEEPTAFNTMITGDKYGLFELIFNEMQETCEGALWNPCHQFHEYNTKPLLKANKKVSAVHNAANREHHEETRIKKKLDEEKKAKCKEQKLSFESKACDKLWKQMEDDEFEKLFAEHEKDWNPNAFKMAKPGEVFPWEIV